MENRDEEIHTSDTFQPYKPTHLDGRTNVFVYMYVYLPSSATAGGGDTCDTAYMCACIHVCAVATNASRRTYSPVQQQYVCKCTHPVLWTTQSRNRSVPVVTGTSTD